MTNEFRKKAVELGKLMNNKSKLSVPLVKCIIECFEIVFSEQYGKTGRLLCRILLPLLYDNI